MAGSRIKGITVEIGGDTTKLQTALKGVNQSVRSTQSQLKDVQKLLKLDPGNTELLVQRQKLLSEAVLNTKEKLLVLKQAAEQANQSLANGKITQEQYDALQREIIETEASLKRLENQANQSSTALQKIGQTGENLKGVGEKVSGIGQKFLPATAAVTALGGIAVKTASDFDAAMSKVSAVSGATGNEFEQLRAKAREMGAKTKFSASEAAEAMNYMAMAGWKTKDMLSGVEGIMDLAAASGEDLATTSDIVTDALTAFGLTAKDSGHFADILAAASSNANTNVAMMGETFRYAAPIAGALGFSAEDTAEAIGLLANSGIKSSQAGTSLRTIMNNLTSDMKLSGRAIGEVSIATTNADGSMRSLREILADCREQFGKLSESEKASNAEALVGKDAMSGFLALMNAAPSDIQKLEGAIDSCDGTAKKMSETMQDNLQGQLTILKSQLEELAISFADLLMPAIRGIVSVLQKFIDFMNQLPEPVRQIILIIAIVVAALGPVIIFIGKIISSIGTILSIVPKVATSLTGMKAIFQSLISNLGGFTAIFKLFSGVGAVVTGLYLSMKNFIDMFQNGFSVMKEILMGVGVTLTAIGSVLLGAPALVSAVVAGIVFVVANLVIAIKGHWTEIFTFLTQLWNQIKEWAITSWQGITEAITTVCTKIQAYLLSVWENISSTIGSVWTSISQFIVSILQTIVSYIVNIWQGFLEIFSPLIESFRYLFETIFMAVQILITRSMATVQDTIQRVWQAIVSFLQPILTALKDFIQQVWSIILSAISNILSAIQNRIVTIWQTIYGFLSNILQQILSVISSLWTVIKNTISNILSTIKNIILAIWNNIKDGIASSVSGIYQIVRNGFERALNYIRGLSSNAFAWGRDIVLGIVHGIKSAVGKVSEAVTSVANKIRAVLHFSVPDEGPLTDYETWMPDFMLGLAEGIEKNRKFISKAMGNVTNDLMMNPRIIRGGQDILLQNQSDNGQLLSMTSQFLEQLKKVQETKDTIMIPVYIGNERIDEIVVSSFKRMNYRSGGR